MFESCKSETATSHLAAASLSEFKFNANAALLTGQLT
jgi:hypothetical protein